MVYKTLRHAKLSALLLIIFLVLISCSDSGASGKGQVSQTQITDIQAESSTDGTIRVSWTPPVNTDPISSYRIVTTNTDTGETHVVDVPASEVTMENARAVVNVASRDGAWSVKVVVINNDDTLEEPKPAAGPVEIIDWQATPPSIVSEVVANASPSSMVLSWNPPDSPGTDAQNAQASISKYTVFFALGTSLSVDTAPLTSTTSTTITFTELTASQEYSFIIQAVNSAGQMSMTQSDTITTPSEESFYLSAVEVQNITATSNTTSSTIEVSWVEPFAGKNIDGTLAYITSYTVHYGSVTQENDPFSIDQSSNPITLSEQDLSVTIPNLELDTWYAIIVQAENSKFDTSESVVQYSKTPVAADSEVAAPPSVTSLTAEADASTPSTTINLQWTAPTSFGLDAGGVAQNFTAYKIYYSASGPPDISTTEQHRITDVATTSYVISGLTKATTYDIAIVVENDNTDNPAYSQSSPTRSTGATLDLAAALPSVTSLVAEADASTPSTTINLQWTAPSSFGVTADGVPQNFIAYKIYYSAAGPPDVTATEQYRITDVSTTSHIISGLTKATSYDIAIVVENDNTDNPAYSQSSPTRTTSATLDLSTAPGAVNPASIERPLAGQTIRQITFLWIAPTPGKDANGADASITYFVYYAEAGQYSANELISLGSSTETTETPLTLQNLNPRVDYDIAIVAANSDNPSISSAPSITSLPSNGVKSIAIQENGATVTSITKAPTDDITLSASVVVENVTDEIVWSAAPSENVLLTVSPTNAKEIQVSPQLPGSTTITATSVADNSMQAEVSLTVTTIDMGSYNLNYGVSPITIGQGNILPVAETTIPTDMNLEYIITAIPDSTGISIVDDTGEIIIVAEPGMYSIIVEVNSFDPFHSGITISSFGIEVTSSVSYKADTDPNAQGYFGIGDVNNSYLFVVAGAEPSQTSGMLEIRSADDLQMYYNNQTIAAVPTGIDGVSGLGPDENDPVDFAQLGNNLKLILTVYQGGDVGSFQIEKMVSKAVPETIDSIAYTPLYSWRDLTLLTSGVNYLVKNNINFPAVGQYGFTRYIPPYPIYSDSYSGYFDGGGFIIDNLYIDETGDSIAGLFGNITDATIKDIIIGPSSIISGESSTGVIAGEAGNSNLINIIVNANITSSAIGSGDVGGIVGYASATTVRGYMTGNITAGSDVGGLVGYSEESTVAGYFTGNITAGDDVGGLAGSSTQSTIAGYFTGNITAGTDVGGLVGYAEASSIYGYTTGTISGLNNIGGLLGRDFIDYSSGHEIAGYSRSKLVVLSSTIGTIWVGNVIGQLELSPTATEQPTLNLYYSESESIIVDDTDTPYTNITGIQGTPVTIATASQSNFTFAFGTNVNEWVWTDGQWPAINIGDLAPPASQPTN